QRLTGALPQLPGDAGQVRLIQQFPSGPEQILYHTGHGQGTEVRLNTDNPHWKISFQDGQAMAAGAPNPLWLAGAILLALAGALAADAQTREPRSRGHTAAGLAPGPSEPVAQRIMQLASQNGTRQASPAREPAPAVQTKAAAPDAEPLAVEELPPLDDVLDIDFLEESAAFTGGRPELPAEIFAPMTSVAWSVVPSPRNMSTGWAAPSAANPSMPASRRWPSPGTGVCPAPS